MIRAALAAAAVAFAFPAVARDYDVTRKLDALRDAARAQERQAESLERLERLERDRALRDDRARRNAARDARSARRFDR